MEEKLIRKMNLDNNLEIKFLDCSKKLMSDRWNLCLLMQIEIPVDENLRNAGDIQEEEISNIIDTVGNSLIFEQKREQVFIDERIKDETLNNMLSSAVDSMVKYLSHPEFAIKYIMKKYKESIEKV